MPWQRVWLQGAASDLALLNAAWCRHDSFAVLPERSAVETAWLDQALAQIPQMCAEGHVALLTSGSTGHPKLIVGSRARAEALAGAIHEAQNLAPVEHCLGLLPLHYSYAFVNQWIWAGTVNCPMIQTDGLRDPAALVNTLGSYANSMICLVGSMVPRLLEIVEDQVLPAVIRINFAGGRFPASQLAALHRHFPSARFFNNYGCAEAMPRLTIREEAQVDSPADPAWLGHPLPGIALQVDQDGALRFRSVYGAVGFVGEEGWQEIAPDEWVATGDLARLDVDGCHLQGRKGEVFKRFGEKVSLPIMLRLAEQHWSGGVSAYRDRDGEGEEGYVFVLAGSPGRAELRPLLRALREACPRTQWPLRVEALAELPLLPNGKPDRDALASDPDRIVLWSQRI